MRPQRRVKGQTAEKKPGVVCDSRERARNVVQLARRKRPPCVVIVGRPFAGRQQALGVADEIFDTEHTHGSPEVLRGDIFELVRFIDDKR
jgi:hypothetical protein